MNFPLQSKSNFILDANGQHIATCPDGAMGEGEERAAQVVALANRGHLAGRIAPLPVITAEPASCAHCYHGGEGCNGKTRNNAGRMFYCTKAKGHEGAHVACGLDTHEMFTWFDPSPGVDMMDAYNAEQGRRLLGAGDIIKDGDEDENGAPMPTSLIGLSATHIMAGKVYRKTGQ